MDSKSIKHMVQRFLSWKLPKPFYPDNFIKFTPPEPVNPGTPYENDLWPSGTNLFDATQAEAMVRHMIEGMPADPTILAMQDRIAVLENENARLREACCPEWFYLAGDMSSDRCHFSPSEVIDEDWLWDNRAEGSAVVQIETACRCPDIWCAVKFFTDEEKDERQLDDEYEITEFATEEEARATLAEGNKP